MKNEGKGHSPNAVGAIPTLLLESMPIFSAAAR